VTFWDELKNPDGSKKYNGNKFTIEKDILLQADKEKLDITLNN
jgi:hypothetical protein